MASFWNKQDKTAKQESAKHQHRQVQEDNTLTNEKMNVIRQQLGDLPYTYTQYEFNPFAHVLGVMRSENLETAEDELDAYCKQMDSARTILVNAYYEKFNQVIRNYTLILSHLSEIKAAEDKLCAATGQATGLFRSRSQEVSSLHQTTLQYKYMVKILQKIEALKKVPHQYSSFITNGNYFEAANLLMKAHTELNDASLSEIGALYQLKGQIFQEREKFHSSLVEVLHNKIYLKAEKAAKIVLISEDNAKEGFTTVVHYNPKDAIDNQKDPGRMVSVLEGQDERDAMTSLVESFWVLDRVRFAINSIVDQISVELQGVIHDYLVSFSKEQSITFRALNENTDDTEPSSSSHFAHILKTLFKTLKAVLSNHQFVCGEFQRRLDRAAPGHELPSLSQTEGRDYRTTYTIEFVWSKFQSELQKLIGTHIGAPSEANSSQTPSEAATIFSFAGSLAFTKYEDEKASTISYENFNFLLPASPYNITPIYPLILNFNDSIVNIIASRDPSSQYGLKNWVDNFVKDTFLPHIKMEYKRRVQNATEGTDSFKPREKSKQLYHAVTERPLLNSAVEINKCLNELYMDVLAMPDPLYVTEFHHIMCDILFKYSNACKNKIQALLEKTETGALLKNEKYRQFIMTDPRYRQIVYDTNIAGRDASAVRHRPAAAGRITLFQPNYQPEPVVPKTTSRTKGVTGGISLDEVEEQTKQDELEKQHELPAYEGKRISDPQQDLDFNNHLFPKSSFNDALALLANMHDSLTWLVRNIHELGKPKPKKGDEENKDNINLSAATYKAKVQHAQLTKLPNINVDMRRFAEECRRLADHCLLALRTELRLWIFCYLDFIRGVPYVYVPELNYERPDDIVTELNKSLSQAHDTLSFYLPREKVNYLFAGLPALTTQILFSSLPKIREIDKFGIGRMKRNTFALQTNFQNMNVLTSEEEFERVRKYYSLLEIKLPDLIVQLQKDIAERSNVFTLEDITRVLEFMSKNNNNRLEPKILKDLQNLYSTSTKIQ